MAKKLTADDAKQSLHDHVAEKGREILEKYGPRIGMAQVRRVLEDRSCVRYPCEIVFASGPLLPGEFAHPVPKGDHPEEGFTIYVHPYYALNPERLPYLIFYQLVLVNYGDFASAEDAETFGASALGLSRDEYYGAVCAMADEISGNP